MNNDTPMTITGNLTADPELRFTAPSLRWATARVTKAIREKAPLAEAWPTPTAHDEMTDVTKPEPAAASAPDARPPF